MTWTVAGTCLAGFYGENKAVMDGDGRMVALVLHTGDEAETKRRAQRIAVAEDAIRALDAAMNFIDSHVADPDITSDMRRAHQHLMSTEPHKVLAKAGAK